MTQVRVKIDITAGTIEVEAPATSYAEVFDKVSEVLPQLVAAHGPPATEAPPKRDASDAGESDGESAKKKPQRRSSGSSKETYKVVELGLSADERDALRKFFKEKKPRTQHDKIAVLLAWLKSEKQKSQVTKDEIYTAFRTVDAKVPAKISSVLGNMVGLGWTTNVGSGAYSLTHVGEDYVKFDLPPQNKAS